MKYDLSKVPFSRFGSYMCFSEYLDGFDKGIWLRTMRGNAGNRNVFKCSIIDKNKELPVEIKTAYTLLTLKTGQKEIEICYHDADILRIHGRNTGFHFSRTGRGYPTVIALEENQYEIISGDSSSKYMLYTKAGQISIDFRPPKATKGRDHIKPEDIPPFIINFKPDKTGELDIILEEFTTSYSGSALKSNFQQSKEKAEKDFQDWLDKNRPAPGEYQEARNLAAYVNYESTIKASLALKRPGCAEK